MVPAQAHPAVLDTQDVKCPRPALHEGPVVDAALPTANKKGDRSDSESDSSLEAETFPRGSGRGRGRGQSRGRGRGRDRGQGRGRGETVRGDGCATESLSTLK